MAEESSLAQDLIKLTKEAIYSELQSDF